MKSYVKNQLGEAIDCEAVVELMDTEICEEMHRELAPCSNQKFYDEYCKRHKEKYDEDFAPDVGMAW